MILHEYTRYKHRKVNKHVSYNAIIKSFQNLSSTLVLTKK